MNIRNDRGYRTVTGTDSKDVIDNLGGKNVTINALAGNDVIKSFSSNVTINAGDGNDHIGLGNNSNVLINGGTGSDLIQGGGGGNNTINGGADDDIIHGNTNNSTINGGKGNDTIYNNSYYAGSGKYGNNMLFQYTEGDGNDIIYGFKDNSTLSIAGFGYFTTKSGNDIIVSVSEGEITLSGAAGLSKPNIVGKVINGVRVEGNYANLYKNSNVLIVGNDSKNSIDNTAENVKIITKGGNDIISNRGGASVSVACGAGNDSVHNYGDSVTIDGGAGNDSLQNVGSNITISGGTGNDTIENNVDINRNAYYDYNGSNVVFKYNPGDGDDIIYGFKDNSTLLIGGNTYTSTKSGNNIIVTVGKGKITLYDAAKLSKVNIETEKPTNTAGNTLISGGDGKDTIINTGTNVTIQANGGDDLIRNANSSVTIDAGDGDDSITNNSQKVSIAAASGKDSVRNEGNSVTIDAGTGNDYIYNQGDNVVFNYKATYGDDVIDGFSANSTLRIGDGSDTYTTVKSGDDIIVKVGDGNITLKGAASLSKVNIAGKFLTVINVENGYTNDQSDAVIFGNDSNNYIYTRVKNVTISGGGGNDTLESYYISDVSINGDAGDDSIRNFATSSTIRGGAGSDSIINYGASVLADAGADNDYIYNINGYKSKIDGGEGDDSINNTISNTKLISGTTINGGAGNDTIRTVGSEAVINAGKGDDKIFNDDSYYPRAEHITFQYNNGDGNDLIQGFQSDSTLSIGGGEHAFSQKSGDDIILTIGEGKVTLQGAAELFRINIVEAPVNISNNDANKTLHGTEGNDTITNKGDNVKIFAYSGEDSITNAKDNVTIDGGTGNDSIKNTVPRVSISGGAGDDYIDNSDNKDNNDVTINGGAGNDTIINDSNNVLFQYNSGDGSDLIQGFNETSTLSIAGDEFSSLQVDNDYTFEVNGNKITLEGAANLSKVNVIGKEKLFVTNNTANNTLISGTEYKDTISNTGAKVTINALGERDSVRNEGNSVSIVGGDGSDTVRTEGEQVTIEGGAGDDSIRNEGDSVTIAGGKGNDTIRNSGDDALFTYNAGDGNDYIRGFDETSSLSMAGGIYTSEKSGSDIIVKVGDDKITLDGAANLPNVNILGTDRSTAVKLMLENAKVNSGKFGQYKYNPNISVLNISDKLKGGLISVTNAEDSAVKANGAFGSAVLNSGNALSYQTVEESSNVFLESETFNDKISFSEDTNFSYGEIQVELLAGSVISTKGDKEISFDNNSSANITAPEGAKININAGTFTINGLSVTSTNGKGTVTVENDGLSFKGYGVKLVDLEIGAESYFGKLAPVTAAYKLSDKSYTIQNTACVKTLSDDFTKLTLDISAAEDYGHFEVNGKEFLVSSVADNINVIEANGNAFKIQDKEVDAEKIGRVTIDEQITFSGTAIDFDGVKTNYALNKPVIYSLDGEEITIDDAATVTTGEETKTITCAAGSYVINGRSFETTADLTFTADANEIRIPLNDAKTNIYFDGVKVSGISDGGELVFDLANDKTFIPDGATLNVTSPDEVKLNLAAGTFTIDDKEISFARELEITVDKDNLKVPLGDSPVTINGAAITGTGTATIDNTDALFFSILLPDGALVQNVSRNTFELRGKDNAAYFGDMNKKVQLTADGTAYVKYSAENTIGVGLNAVTFEQVEILDSDAWTVETSGASGIDRIKDIADGATILPVTEGIDVGDVRFEVVENDGNIYVVRGNSDGEIKTVPLADEFKDDDSEAAGKIYEYDAAGDYTVNGITFHAEKDSKAQTITRGVEFDLSSGAFEYDVLTLEGSGTAQINRYNASLITLTDGAKVSGDDESKYFNRRFEINGTVELVGKKFETDSQIRCELINVQDTWEISVGDQTAEIPVTVSGFIVDDKYVQIQDDCYDGVKVVDGKIATIEGVKASAEITGSGLSNVTIEATESGEFYIRGKAYKISGDSDGVTFVTDSHGNLSEINGLAGSVEGNFENEILINGKAVRLTGASKIKVTSDGENIEEISNVAGELVEADDTTYRKDVRVYKLGGAEELTTSSDGTIIFNGNKFKANAGKTFELDSSGEVVGFENLQSNALVSANVSENFVAMELTTTDGLEEVFGDFSEGLTVNGVLVKVTDSTNFVVKNDEENIYIETTAADTFTINGKTFETSADKTIFKLDAEGNVSEIVTDTFLTDDAAYFIAGDFNDAIIFNGKEFCVTGTNGAKIFISDETMIGIELASNSVEVVESGGAAEIALSGAGELTVGDKTFNTSEDFVGSLHINAAGNVYAADYFVGTLSGELGGLELEGITINSNDTFSATGDGEKLTALNNLQNGSFTSSDLHSMTINSENVILDNAQETTVTVNDGEVDAGDIAETFLDKLIEDYAEDIIFATENVTLGGGDVVVVEDTTARVSITASAGEDTIYTAGKQIDIDLKAGGATEIFAAEGRATIENYDATNGAAFIVDDDIAETIAENKIAFDDGRLTVNAAQVTFLDEPTSKLINFVDAAGDTQKVFFASDSSKLDASKETANLILVGGNDSTILGGKSSDTIFASEGNLIDFGGGRNVIKNFTAENKISVEAATADFNFDGENVSIKSGNGKAILESVATTGGAAEISLIDGKAYVARDGENISVNETADLYFGKKSGVDFSSYDESLTLDLSKNFNGINRVTVGGGLNTLITSSANETLTSNAEGTTQFIFDAGAGHDLIQNFNFDEDKISIGSAVSNVVLKNSGDVIIQLGDDRITLEDAQGKIFRINDFTALVDKNITYDDAANYFLATSKNASVIVGEEAEVWLDGSHGKNFVGNIKTLDASTSDGRNTLAGNDNDNVICAGLGDASLWGAGGNDLLIGGKAHNLFFHTSGNDTIQAANDGDAVILSTVTLDQISSTSITSSGVAINFTGGGSLTVDSTSDITYQLADGSQFSANHDQLTWQAK